MTKQTRRSISMKESTYKQLEAYALKFSRSKSSVVEQLIAEFFAPAQEALHNKETTTNDADDADDAVRDVCGSGLHLL